MRRQRAGCHDSGAGGQKTIESKRASCSFWSLGCPVATRAYRHGPSGVTSQFVPVASNLSSFTADFLVILRNFRVPAYRFLQIRRDRARKVYIKLCNVYEQLTINDHGLRRRSYSDFEQQEDFQGIFDRKNKSRSLCPACRLAFT